MDEIIMAVVTVAWAQITEEMNRGGMQQHDSGMAEHGAGYRVLGSSSG